MNKLNLAVVMPVYNEQECIEKVIRDWLKILRSLQIGFKFIIVDDGSSDGTRDIILKMLTSVPEIEFLRQDNAGHGPAILSGYRRALSLNAEWIFATDSDDQIPAECFLWLWRETVHPYCAIMGIRKQRHDPFIRIVLSQVFKILIFIFFGTWIVDPNIPFRLMHRSFLLQAIGLIPATTFAPNIHLSILIKKFNISLKRVDIIHLARKTGTGSIKLSKIYKIGLKCLKDLILFKKAQVRECKLNAKNF